MASHWSYSTTCAIDDSNTPMLVLDARTDVPLAFGNNTIFATSQLDLCLAVSADGLSVQSVALATSAVIREIVDWLRKNRSKLGIDAVGVPEATVQGVTIPLFVAVSTTRTQSLVLNSSITPTSPLSSITLSLHFLSSESLRVPASSPSSQTSAQDSFLIHQLLAPSPFPLHFTLVPLVDTALSRLFRNLSKAFPLCFNPLWVQRLKNDLNPFRLISDSISKILDPATLISTGQLDIDELSLVNKTKQDLISLLSPMTSSGFEQNREQSSISSREAVEKSFLLVAKQPKFVDPLEFSCSSSLKPVKDQSSKAGTSRGRGRGRGKGRGRGRGTGRGRGKRIDTVAETSLRRGGRKRKSTFSDGLYQTEGGDSGLFEGFEAMGNGSEEGNEKTKAWTGDGFGAGLIEDDQEEDGTAARLDDENGMDARDMRDDEWLLCEGGCASGDEGVLEF